jgi:hypothetical protein
MGQKLRKAKAAAAQAGGSPNSNSKGADLNSILAVASVSENVDDHMSLVGLGESRK